MNFNPPPNWPAPPPGWQPGPDWRPDPSWGPVPPGWSLWIDDDRVAGARTGKTSIIAGAAKHPVWITVGTVVGVLALVATVTGSLLSGERRGDVDVGNVSTGPAEPIDATGVAPGLGEVESVTSYTATPIDITLTNNGGTPVRFVEIHAEPQDSLNWICNQRGGGVAITANYSVTLPTKFADESTLYLAESGSAPIDFTVKAESSDRMVVTMGPDGGLDPYVYFSTLRLVADDGNAVVTRPLALVTPAEVDEQLDIAGDPEMQSRVGFDECLSDYLASAERMTPDDAIRSAEFDRWIDGLEAIRRS